MIPTPADLDLDATGVLLAAIFGVLGLLVTGLGIIASGYIAAKVTQRPILAARHERLSALSAIADNGRRVLAEAKMECDNFDADTTISPVFELDRFRRIESAIAGLPLLEISPGYLVDGLLELRADLINGLITMDDFLRNAPAGVGGHNIGGRFDNGLTRAELLLRNVMLEAGKASKAETNWWRL
jgi:hypothetical protein